MNVLPFETYVDGHCCDDDPPAVVGAFVDGACVAGACVDGA